MIVKAIGILLVVGGVGVIGTGVYGMASIFDGGTPNIPGTVMRMFGGMALLMGGAFTLAFTARSRMGRGLHSILKRLQGTRIDEEIARLAKLRGDGYITGEEYEAAKKKLLDDM